MREIPERQEGERKLHHAEQACDDPPARSGAKHPAPAPGLRISIAVIADAG